MLSELYLRFDPKRVKATYNGPYGHAETELRALGHIAVLWSRVLRVYPEDTIAKDYVAYIEDVLLNTQLMGTNGLYVVRQEASKDDVNGLIGQAWILEALYACWVHSRNDALRQRADLIIGAIPFDWNLNLWEIVDSKNVRLGIDNAFNHQIWYAASVLNWSNQNKSVLSFVKHFKDFLRLEYNGGCIYHKAELKKAKHNARSFRDKLKMLVQLRFSDVLFPKIKEHRVLMKKSIGYHSFNLLGINLLLSRIDGIECDELSKLMATMIEFCDDSKYKAQIKNNLYGPAYNASYLEEYIVRSNIGQTKLSLDLLNKQNSVPQELFIRDETIYAYRMCEIGYIFSDSKFKNVLCYL